ncbi:hypothetical protein, partial [Streptomyces erythrochromogenes]|uniref:hypothetical protein n=1 Tax=Streptomyces erythrochromogenes TaxID=285574 RepID=UPI0036804016
MAAAAPAAGGGRAGAAERVRRVHQHLVLHDARREQSAYALEGHHQHQEFGLGGGLGGVGRRRGAAPVQG